MTTKSKVPTEYTKLLTHITRKVCDAMWEHSSKFGFEEFGTDIRIGDGVVNLSSVTVTLPSDDRIKIAKINTYVDQLQNQFRTNLFADIDIQLDEITIHTNGRYVDTSWGSDGGYGESSYTNINIPFKVVTWALYHNLEQAYHEKMVQEAKKAAEKKAATAAAKKAAKKKKEADEIAELIRLQAKYKGKL